MIRAALKQDYPSFPARLHGTPEQTTIDMETVEARRIKRNARAKELRAAKKQARVLAEATEKLRIESIGPLHDQPAPKYPQGHYAHGNIKSRLGWTDALIKTFLGNPDYYKENPYYKGGPEIRMYSALRIAKVESTDDFKAAMEKSAIRKDAAFLGTLTRSDNMSERMREAEITIVKGQTTDQIYALALATHGGNYDGDPGEFHWNNRKARNCIRHNLTNYETLWKLCNRGETGQDAYDILRIRVDDLIDETYPQFAEDEEGTRLA